MNNQNKAKEKSVFEMQQATLSDILNLDDVQHFQDLFSNAHGVASIITDTEGKPITQPSNFTRLCEGIIRKTEKGCANCFHSDAVIGRYNPAGPVVQPCLSGGLWDAGVSITVGGMHIANWLIGQVRNEQIDEQQMMQYADEIGAEQADFKAALNDVPEMSEVQFHKIADLLFYYANELSEKAYSNIQLKKHIEENEKITALLQEREENLATTLHSIGDGVITTDKNGSIVNMNPVAEKLCGWMLTEATARPLTEVFKIVNSKTRETVADPVNKVLQSGKIIGLANHTVLLSKNGAEYQIADSAAPIKSKEGSITGVVLVFSDVTENYIAQKLINDNEVRFRGLLENLETGIVVHAADSTVIVSNTRASELLGISKDQMNGKTAKDPAWKFVNEDNSPLPIENYPVNKIISTKKSIKSQILGIRQPGKKGFVWVTVNGFPSFDDKGNIAEIVISFIDITESNKAKSQLVISEKKLKEAQRIAHLGNWELDITNNILFWSDEIYRIFDCEPNEFKATYEAFLEFIHPDDREMVNSAYLNSLETKKEYQIEHRLITKTNQIKFVREKCSTTFNEQGEPKSSFGIVLDITEQKQIEIELQKAKEKAEDSDRLKSAFLANMSHEIRTPMNGILGFAQLLKKPGLNGEKQQAFIEIIEKSGKRMLNIINDIIDISKIESGLMNLDSMETNINELAEDIHTFFKPEANAKKLKLSFKNSLAEQEAIIKTDSEKVYAILTNLVKNAIKYTPEGSIEFGYTLKKHNESGELEFYVKDTGIGIPKERHEAIFERFIQAEIADKMAIQGAGLGLAITKAYIEMLDGSIWVESEEGKGSTFYFTIPYNAEPATR